MGGLVVREVVTLAGRAERAGVARAFVAGVLGPGHPCGDDAVPAGTPKVVAGFSLSLVSRPGGGGCDGAGAR
jgi:hypothetical protein